MRVFVYNLMFNKIAAVSKACSVVGAELVTVSKDDIHKSVEYIIGEGKTPKPMKDSNDMISELMIFEGFTSDSLDAFLDAYKQTKAPSVTYKAMVTPINKKWSLTYLYSHLVEEAGH
ncbi:MAG: DUF3783 domain-containing protein [Pseudobutyrivibrio ruminis]|nr:DUF3783 domain-containing protein [Pseudobutyrivibrio ruminis]